MTEVNEALEDSPEMLNEDPYEAWIAVLEIDDTDEANGLMDRAAVSGVLRSGGRGCIDIFPARRSSKKRCSL